MHGRQSRTASARSISSDDVLRDANNFSLVLGGPLFQLLRRARLSDDALSLVRRRIVFAVLLMWGPLLLLSALERHLLGNVAVPFLHDLEAQIRFLLAVPLLIVAELIVHQRMRPIVRTFLDRQLIPADALPRFDAAINSALRLRNSVLVESLMVAFVYGVGVLLVWRQYIALDASTWYASPRPDGGSRLTWAGMWYGFFSLPVFQFLLMRWYFRLFIWARFLWQVSRLPLALMPTHPDRVGGLGFLAGTVLAFMPLAVAHGVMLAGPMANRIFFLGAKLTEFKVEIGVMLAFMMIVIFGPLLVFSAQLAETRRLGLRRFGTLAQQYVREFNTKWLNGDDLKSERKLLGSADIQSLADLANSYEVVSGMRMAPITRNAIVQLGIGVLAPVAPLLLTMMPLEQLLKRLAGIVL